MVPSPPHVPGSWAPLRPVERAAGPSLPRLRALAAFALLSVGCLLCNPLVLPPAPSANYAAVPAAHRLVTAAPPVPHPPSTDPSSPSASFAAGAPAPPPVPPPEAPVPRWLNDSVEAAAAAVLIPAIVILMWDAATLWQQHTAPMPEQPPWLMAAAGADGWTPWQKNNVPHKSDLLRGLDSDDSDGSGSDAASGEGEGEGEGSAGPTFRPVIERTDAGDLIGGWGHVLTAEERLQYQEGDAVADDVIERWAQADGFIPGKRTAASLQQLFVRGFSPTVVRDPQDGELYAGFGHRLTAEERQRFTEGDAVDAATLQRWLDRQILDLDMTDDDDEGEEEGADADGVSADGEDGRPRSAEER